MTAGVRGSSGAGDAAGDPRSAGSGLLLEVSILALPLAIWARAHEHAEGLRREITLVVASEASAHEHHVPRRLLALFDELDADFAALTGEQQPHLAEAADQGRDAIDLLYRVPPEITGACRRLAAAMDAADRYCEEGRYLLSLATPPDALAFRRWYLGEFVRQAAGEPPLSWPAWVATHGVAPPAGPGDRP